jgi:hypothetical protein
MGPRRLAREADLLQAIERRRAAEADSQVSVFHGRLVSCGAANGTNHNWMTDQCRAFRQVEYMTLAYLGPQGRDRTLLSFASHCSRVITGGLPIPQPVQQTLRRNERRQMHVMGLAACLSNS